ncbi:hypothetical protein ADL19_09670 [Streptomyces purpurogeneiscleroticus]|jgi:hypothetical protein|nr:hypothetical protein ADL19_09670 [Streptomyces purpurogeneiscleroticus]
MAMVIPAATADPTVATAAPAGTAILVAMDGLTAATEGLAAALAMGEVTDAPSAAMAVMEDRATDPAPPQRTISPAVDATEVAVMSVPRNKAGRGAPGETVARAAQHRRDRHLYEGPLKFPAAIQSVWVRPIWRQREYGS